LDNSIPVSTVRLGEGEMQLLREVKDRILKCGIASIEDLPAICPRCGSIIPNLKITAERWKCGNCGYEQKGISIRYSVTFGSVIGAALAALLWWLSRSEGGDKQ